MHIAVRDSSYLSVESILMPLFHLTRFCVLILGLRECKRGAHRPPVQAHAGSEIPDNMGTRSINE